VPLFDQLNEKALNNFMPYYLVPELSTQEFPHRLGRSRLPSIYSLAKHSGATDEDWTTPHRLERPKERSSMTRPTIQKILEDHGVLPKV
jgi:hypothetical protein